MSASIETAPKNLEPINLLPDIDAPKPYPSEALGELLGGAVAAIACAVQVPDALAAQSVLTAAALAAQPHANIVRLGQRIPISIFGLTVAGSGDRKTSADQLALNAHRAYQQKLKKDYVHAYREFNNLRENYQKARAAALEKNKNSEPGVGAAELNKLKEPVEPQNPIILVDDPTIEGLQKSLLRGHPSQGFFSDEGGLFFGGYAGRPENLLKSISALSRLWDGAPITRTRAAEGESANRSGCRLAAHLMIQPTIAQDVLSNPILHGQGFLARFLIAWPASLAGTRLYRDVDPTKDGRLIAFWQCMDALLATPLRLDEQNELSPPDLNLEPAALSAWIRYHDNIEKTLGRGGELHEIKATAAKSAENALRIAGVMAVTEGLASVTEEIVERATTLSRWYLHEALRIAYPVKIETQQLQAQQLLDWLSAKSWGSFNARKLQREGPSFIRKSCKHRDHILAVLVEHRWLATADGREFYLNSAATVEKLLQRD